MKRELESGANTCKFLRDLENPTPIPMPHKGRAEYLGFRARRVEMPAQDGPFLGSRVNFWFGIPYTTTTAGNTTMKEGFRYSS